MTSPLADCRGGAVADGPWRRLAGSKYPVSPVYFGGSVCPIEPIVLSGPDRPTHPF